MSEPLLVIAPYMAWGENHARIDLGMERGTYLVFSHAEALARYLHGRKGPFAWVTTGSTFLDPALMEEVEHMRCINLLSKKKETFDDE